MRRACLAVAAALLLAGCGESERDTEPAGERSNAYVDLAAEPPLINGLDIDPATGELLLTTNQGFFRIDPESGEASEVKGEISSGSRTSTIGTFLYVYARGPNDFIGSGHPDQQTLPEFLGFIESKDGGRTWKVLSRLGEADLHKIVIVDDRLYAFDAVLGAMLMSDDGGRTFTEKFTPRGLIIDFVVDPEDPDHILASNEEQLFRTEDGGDAWRPVALGEGIRLDWAAPDALYRTFADGLVERSSDGGETWERVGQVEGEPYKFKSVGPEELYLALSDATIVHTTDGGTTWETVFEP